MDKHTPLIENNEEQRKAKPPPEERQYSRERIKKNNKKSKVPLIPAQKNKYHYNIEQKPLQEKFLASTWLNKQRRTEETLTTFL